AVTTCGGKAASWAAVVRFVLEMKFTAPVVGRPLTLVIPPCQVPQLTPSVGSLPALASVAPLGEIAGLTAVSPKLTPSLPRGAVKPATEPDGPEMVPEVPCCAPP